MTDVDFDLDSEEFTISIEEDTNPLYINGIFFLKRKNYRLCVGTYRDLVNLHRQLKNVIQYNYIDNKQKLTSVSHNDKYFYIKNTKSKKLLGMPNEYVKVLSGNIGRLIYAKMTEFNAKKAPEQAK